MVSRYLCAKNSHVSTLLVEPSTGDLLVQVLPIQLMHFSGAADFVMTMLFLKHQSFFLHHAKFAVELYCSWITSHWDE